MRYRQSSGCAPAILTSAGPLPALRAKPPVSDPPAKTADFFEGVTADIRQEEPTPNNLSSSAKLDAFDKTPRIPRRRQPNTVAFGQGDWNHDGTDDPGVYRPGVVADRVSRRAA